MKCYHCGGQTPNQHRTGCPDAAPVKRVDKEKPVIDKSIYADGVTAEEEFYRMHEVAS